MRKLIKKIIFQIKLWGMDHQWRFSGQSSYSMFPPSFYYTHTPEEIERLKREEIAKIRRILDGSE